jgi:flavin-dependent dehydrogenase
MTDAEILVLGGGAAGAAAALTLARAGRRVLLLEREAAPREKVCGEFLGADAASCLEALGLAPASLGAVPVGRARLAHGAAVAELALPFAAWGLPRRRLDEALLAAAAEAGAMVHRGLAAQGAAREGAAWAVRLADGTVLRAPRLVLATGKHELRGHARAAPPGAVGLKLHLRLADPPEGVVLLVCRGGYAGLQPSGDGLANLCVALKGEAVPRDAAALLAHVAAGSDLAARLLAGAVPVMPRPLAVAGIPYGFRHRDPPGADPGLYRVGDQAAVIPSLAGDGVAMALASGIGAAEAILAGSDAPAFHAAWRRRSARPMHWAGAAAALVARWPGPATRLAGRLPAAGGLVARRTRLPG